MKTYVIILSKKYPKGHSYEGANTNFADLLKRGKKIHTIRCNYPLWQKRIAEVQMGEACLSIRQWEDKPYRSKQVEIARLTKDDGVGLEYLILPPVLRLENILNSYPKLDHHDGLTHAAWLDWFENYPRNVKLPIIHFTKFRYNENNI